MKKQFLFLSTIAFMVLAASCNKDDKDTPTPSDPDPVDSTVTPTPTAPTAPTPAVANVYGTLVSVSMKYSYTNSMVPMPVSIESEVAVAAFPTALNSSTLADAGTVSVNSITLEKADNNAYYKSASVGMTPATLDFTTGSSWSVGGSGSVAGFTYNHTGDFPEYTGDLPTTITKSSDLVIDLGTSHVSDADSVYIVVAAGNTFVQKSVAGNASSATITSAELAGLPDVSDNTALIEVVPFRIDFETFNGKVYAFIKERAVVSSVNID